MLYFHTAAERFLARVLTVRWTSAYSCRGNDADGSFAIKDHRKPVAFADLLSPSRKHRGFLRMCLSPSREFRASRFFGLRSIHPGPQLA
jgi:hypothetical protein